VPIITLPTGSDEEMVFQTFRGYLSATCNWARDLYPHAGGLLPGLEGAVKARRWMTRTPANSMNLTNRGAEILRNGWATEVLLNSPRVLGGGDLIAFANLWAPVQAYYAVFEVFTALHMTIGGSKPPKTHAGLLAWAGGNIAHANTPFVVPWTARVGGAPGAWTFDGFGTTTPNPGISNLSAPHAANAPHLLAKGLMTTRREQIDDHHDKWLEKLTTRAGMPRKNLPAAILTARATAMRPTTLFDLLWRLRVRSNYKEGDALLSGALGPADAATFHDALSEIVAATLLTTEIYLAHVVGKAVLQRCADMLQVPPALARHSMSARIPLW